MKALKLLAAAPLIALLAVSCESPDAGPSAGGASASRPSASPVSGPVEKNAPKPPPAESKPVASKPPSPPAPEASLPKPTGQVSKMDLGTLFSLQGEGRALVLDVRPAFFYNLGHIPGAISMPLKQYDTLFPAKRAEFDAALKAGKVIVIYCADENCPDGRSTARRMAKEGYSTSVYTAGWKEWKSSGL